ncbi:MAG TPA: DUF4255 domain-containing protein [Terriglobia bacterium]|nr:DUF4255 domain-containing protein [Terriglobia bacterium]
MANISAIRSVGISLADYLNHAYSHSTFPPNVTKPECKYSLRSIGGIKTEDVSVTDSAVRVLIFLYRVMMNQHVRNVGRMTDSGRRPVPLSVDLHYLFSFWSKSVESEQLVLAWTMRQFHEVPLLDGSTLSGEAAWGADEVIQVIPEEITNEDMLRIWETIEPNYRLSLSYVARVVRIDPDETPEHPQVVATRFDYAVPGLQS